MFIKSFNYLAIIVIIAILNNGELIQAKSFGEQSNLANMDDAPEKPPEFESSISRIRRAVEPNAADESDIPKDQLHSGSRFRTRRQTEPSQPEVPKGFKNIHQNRAKRQIPSPPGEMPMPPM